MLRQFYTIFHQPLVSKHILFVYFNRYFPLLSMVGQHIFLQKRKLPFKRVCWQCNYFIVWMIETFCSCDFEILIGQYPPRAYDCMPRTGSDWCNDIGENLLWSDPNVLRWLLSSARGRRENNWDIRGKQDLVCLQVGASFSFYFLKETSSWGII